MEKIDALDTLENITNKLEFLLSSTYFMMLAQKNGDIDLKGEEISGFYEISNEVVDALKTYMVDVSPLIHSKEK